MSSKVFANIDKYCQPHAVLASHTACCSITAISAQVRKPENVVGMHFFYPVPVMRAVEVVKGFLTSEDACRQAVE